MQMAGDAAALFILQMQDAGRKLAEAGVGSVDLAGLIGHFESFLDQFGGALVNVALEIFAATQHFLLGVLAVGGVDGDAYHAQGSALRTVGNFGAGSEPAFFAVIGANDLMLGNPFFAFFGEGGVQFGVDPGGIGGLQPIAPGSKGAIEIEKLEAEKLGVVLAPGEFIFGDVPFEAAGAAGGLRNVEKFVGAGQIFLGLLADRNLIEGDDEAIACGVGRRQQGNADVAPDARTILADVTFFAGVVVAGAMDHFLQRRPVAGHEIGFGNLHERHLAELIGAVAENLAEQGIDAEKAALQIYVGQPDAGAEKSGFEMVVQQVEGFGGVG